MSVVEKNDVDISKLFTWGKKFEIVGEDESVVKEIYIRLLGDADLNKARVYALRKSADLRRKLKTPDTDERLAIIFDPDSQEKERLVTLVLGLSMRELAQETTRNTDLPYPKAPKSDAPLEAMEKYQLEVDEYDKKRSDLFKKNLEKEVEKLTKALNKLSKEELISRYENAMINEACEQEVINSFKDYSAYAGSYTDSDYKERLFTSIDEFLNLPTEVKDQFINAQQSIELSGDELKKSRLAMR